MANLVANSGCNKGQLSYLVEAICLLFLQLKELLPGLVRHQLPQVARTSATTICQRN